MGGHVYAFMDSSDMEYVIESDLRKKLGQEFDIRILTNSKQLFDYITCSKRTAERQF